MTDGLDLLNDIQDLTAALARSVQALVRHGRDYAEKEKEYKVRLMEESLKLRDGGMPVTLIDKVVYGIVAEERRDRDVAEAMYKACQENINAIKLRLRLVDNQIEREWGRREK